MPSRETPFGPSGRCAARAETGGSQWLSGVVIFGASDEAILWARFYLEPVDVSDATVDDAIREQMARR